MHFHSKLSHFLSFHFRTLISHFNFDSQIVTSNRSSSFRLDRLAKERDYYAKEIENDRARVDKYKEEQKEYEAKKAVRLSSIDL